MNFNQDVIDNYNESEIEGKKLLSNREISAFKLVIFDQISEIYIVEKISDLWRMHDSMHWGRQEQHINYHFSKGITSNLFEKLNWGLNTIKSFSHLLAPPPRIKLTAGQDSLVSAIVALQYFDEFCKSFLEKAELKVMELGPGSGYLSLLLSRAGHKVFCVEASQGFFLYQYFLFNHFAEQEQINLLDIPKQLHWWDIANIDYPIECVDVVIANHMVSEMTEMALRIILCKLKNIWMEHQKDGYFVAESLGGGGDDKTQRALEIFQSYGFRGFKLNSFYIFVFSDKSQTQLQLNFQRMFHNVQHLYPEVSKEAIFSALQSDLTYKSADAKLAEFVNIKM